MSFVPTPEKLIPQLTPEEEIVFLARTLWREGYNDHLAGHITYNLGDGTFLCNPWLLTWRELRPEQIIRIDLEGNVVEGEWPAPPGIPLHLEFHKARHDVKVALHNHPTYGTLWSDVRQLPPVYDQSSSISGGDLVLVNEYGGGVTTADVAGKAVEAIGSADMALLAGHGVFVTGVSIAAAHLRAVTLETRCNHAWRILSATGGVPSAVPDWFLEQTRQHDGTGFHGFWEQAVRAELDADPSLLPT